MMGCWILVDCPLDKSDSDFKGQSIMKSKQFGVGLMSESEAGGSNVLFLPCSSYDAHTNTHRPVRLTVPHACPTWVKLASSLQAADNQRIHSQSRQANHMCDV